MLKTFLASVVILLCVGCKEDKVISSSFNKQNFKEHFIHDIKGTLLLPKEYQRITTENEDYFFSKIDSTSAIIQMITYLDKDRLDYVLFTKENDLDDFIFIHKTDHVNFSKQDANRYLGMVELMIKGRDDYQGYTRLQNKMTRTERSTYIKIKYKIDYPEGSLFRTQYVVTSNISTFEILEMRRDITDYEDLFKRINYTVN